MKKILAVLVFLVSSTSAASRPTSVFRVTLKRETNDLYSVSGTDVVLKTRLCSAYGFSSEALIYWYYKGSWNNEIVWLDFQGKPDKMRSNCRIEKVYIETSL